MDDAVWDASTFSKNQDRLWKADGAQEFPATLLSVSIPNSAKVRGLCGCVRDFGDYEDCVVADAVGFEHVSTTEFPANREKNREFCDFWSESGIWAPSRLANSIAYREIPCATEQGLFPAEQGNNFKEQGISVAKMGCVVG